MNILWDFDGTLFNTYPAYTEILSRYLDDNTSKEDIYKKLKISFSHAMESFQIPAETEKEIRKKQTGVIPPQDIQPFEHVEQVLQFADKNVIMTHKHRAGVTAILRHYGWEKYFADMVTGDDGYPRKPDPSSYSYLHDKHTIHLAIGDRELDLLPARQLGIPTCMFQNECEAADFHIYSYDSFFSDVAPYLKK